MYRGFINLMMGSSGASYTTRTTDFASATGISDPTILNALNDFDLGLTSSGLDSKMYALYPYVGSTALTHSFNFIDTSLFQMTWSGGITHNSNGVLSNGVNGIGQTNFNPTIESVNQNNFAFGMYSITNNTSLSFDMGSTTGVRCEIDLYNSGRYILSHNSGFTSSNLLSRTDGFFINSRISSANYQFFRNGVLFQSISSVSTGLNNTNFQVISAQGFATPSTKQIALSFISQGLDSAESLTFYNLVQDFQTALSRQV